MRHPIDPKIDCVFKALLGSEDNRNLLLHFLNAILAQELPAPLVGVAILNPYNERGHRADKLSIVNIKARDDQSRLYQIEIQLLSFPDLPARILYGWAELYRQQLQRGQDYDQLRPTYAIWLLAEALLPDDADYAHRYRLRDDQGRALIDHGGIWLLELSKFSVAQVVTEQQRWLKFFTDGEGLDAAALPPWMQTDEMRQAMTTLIAFSDKERAYHLYQARQNFLRQQRSMKRHLLEARAAKEEALQAREAAVLARDAERKEKETALQEKEAERQAKEAERQEKEIAVQEKEAERQAKEVALQEKTAALAEIERLKALLQGTPAP